MWRKLVCGATIVAASRCEAGRRPGPFTETIDLRAADLAAFWATRSSSLWRLGLLGLVAVLATAYGNLLKDWRRRPDLNRRWRFCRPLPYHLATAPFEECVGDGRAVSHLAVRQQRSTRRAEPFTINSWAFRT